MLENMGWLLVVALGPLILAGALIYAYVNRRRLSRREKEQQHRAVQELYDDTPERRAEKERIEAAAQATESRRSSG
jgi:C4-dicarboxylate-specific signal transduction histidine kinase